MKFGVVFPQTEIGTDPTLITEYAQTAESLGYNHIIAFDHVLGANIQSRPGWQGAYQHSDAFHEPFVLYAFLSAVTKTIELTTAVIILPQRQTVLAAKQAAALDVLSKGRLRLGIGTGWNEVEYEALGENFGDRGRRSEEQITLMRKLWTNELVTFKGRWHTVTDAGLNPLPIQRPIPIWLGGKAEPVIARVARSGDGWFPLFPPDDAGKKTIEHMRSLASSFGRDPFSIGIESFLSYHGKSENDWIKEVNSWDKIGITHLSINTMNAGIKSPQGHLDAIRKFKEAIDHNR